MKQKITLSLWNPPKEEPAPMQKPEEVTLYGQGAGLYSYLNILAERLADPGFDKNGFPIHH